MGKRNDASFKLLVAASLGDFDEEFRHYQDGAVAGKDILGVCFKYLTQVVISFYWPERIV